MNVTIAGLQSSFTNESTVGPVTVVVANKAQRTKRSRLVHDPLVKLISLLLISSTGTFFGMIRRSKGSIGKYD